MRYHFSGLAGAGMNPLARLMRAWGHDVQGSDRGFDRGQSGELRQGMDALGIRVVIQDGAGVTPNLDRFVYSAAVESITPEQQRAAALGLERLARPALLAEVVNAAKPGIAIAGTSGKSTTSAMIHWCLDRAGIDHTALGGAALHGGDGGCFRAGAGPTAPVVAEACESDGTLIGYRPGIALIHNITRDHSELDGLRAQFATFATQSTVVCVNARCRESLAVTAAHPRRITYGVTGACDLPIESISVGPHRARGVLRLGDSDVDLDLPQPGMHTLENAGAALAVIHAMGLDVVAAAEALRAFPGVARRFAIAGVSESGIRVVDDYAHNADKIRAAVSAAQAGCDRLVAVFQPHGFGPAKFLRDELRDLWPSILRPRDALCYLGIFDAGGTADRSISSADLCADLAGIRACHHAPTHADLLPWAAETAQANDTILIMGARDARLSALATAVAGLV